MQMPNMIQWTHMIHNMVAQPSTVFIITLKHIFNSIDKSLLKSKSKNKFILGFFETPYNKCRNASVQKCADVFYFQLFIVLDLQYGFWWCWICNTVFDGSGFWHLVKIIICNVLEIFFKIIICPFWKCKYMFGMFLNLLDICFF